MSGSNVNKRIAETGKNFYETPIWAIEELLKKEIFQGTILEPCSGRGAISKVLEENKYQVDSSDISVESYVYGEKGVDLHSINKQYPNIITNPPYGRAINKTVLKLHEIFEFKMALLLRLSFLAGSRRKRIFELQTLKKVYIFANRVTMYPYGQTKPENTGQVDYAWFVWDKSYKGKPQIERIERKEI